MKANNIITRK